METSLYTIDLIIIIISIVLFLFLPARALYIQVKRLADRTGQEIEPLQEDAFPIIDDLIQIITRECQKVFDTGFVYIAARHAGSLEHSLLNNPIRVITDEIVDRATMEVTEKIIDDLSDNYRERLYMVISPINLEEYILEEVYHLIFEEAMRVNRSTM